jgi:microcin C transport system permease protein
MSRRRWRVFFGQKRALLGLFIFGFLFLVSMTAELWSHHYPLVIVRSTTVEGTGEEFGNEEKRERRVFFPAFVQYSVKDFGITDAFVIDFQELLAADKAEDRGTIAIFPMNRWDPFIQTDSIMTPPSAEHYLGTDSLGRDVLARLIYGIRVSLLFGLLMWSGAYFIGVMIGIVQGYFAGKIDFVTERVKELAEIMPVLMLIILINGVTRSQSFAITLCIVIALFWISISSQMRAQVLALRKREFVDSVIAMGGTHWRALFRHILPNAITPVLTLTPFAISAGISILAVLDYLGFGLSPPTPSLGELLLQGRTYITNAVWLLLAPTSALVLLLISINMMGEALRTAFDPRAN